MMNAGRQKEGLIHLSSFGIPPSEIPSGGID